MDHWVNRGGSHWVMGKEGGATVFWEQKHKFSFVSTVLKHLPEILLEISVNG